MGPLFWQRRIVLCSTSFNPEFSRFEQDNPQRLPILLFARNYASAQNYHTHSEAECLQIRQFRHLLIGFLGNAMAQQQSIDIPQWHGEWLITETAHTHGGQFKTERLSNSVELIL
ncbi:hypothetical protein AVEN_201638-1 [Araneus ventricosus]|uniref:Uncharacterized protein n=1 Tax=Araneus ventricosus TaxID=182803 RepID=A0A4Y2KC21_ARAVE|nr:hypothetical protein AVEN_201638-1 [Araneus ventricosus]